MADRRSEDTMRTLGIRLHPESVTEAWYAADCLPAFDPKPHIPRRDYLRWKLSRWLRQR